MLSTTKESALTKGDTPEMSRLARMWTFGFALAIAACTGEDSGKGGVGGASGADSDASGASGKGGAAGAMGGTTGTAGGARDSGTNPNWCALQGKFVGSVDAKLPMPTCGHVPFKTTYDITINGTMLTLTQHIENVPMTGTIDAMCKGTASLVSPPREFTLTFDPGALTAMGTYKDGDASTCITNYDLSIVLTPAP